MCAAALLMKFVHELHIQSLPFKCVGQVFDLSFCMNLIEKFSMIRILVYDSCMIEIVGIFH